MIEEGANVFRFNFSHGDHPEQGARMATVHRAEEIAGHKVGFLLDTKGPEMRTELFADGADAISVVTGDKFRVATKQGLKSTPELIALNVAGGLDIFDDVEIGQTILIDDGKLGLSLTGKDAATREFEVEAQNDGVIGKQKGVNIPNTKIPFQLLLNVMMRISVSDFHNLVESTLSLSHSYVLQMTLKKYVVFVKKLEIHTYNFWLKLKTNKVSKTLMKSSKQLMVS